MKLAELIYLVPKNQATEAAVAAPQKKDLGGRAACAIYHGAELAIFATLSFGHAASDQRFYGCILFY